MSEKRESTLLENMATKIGSALGVIAAEAAKAVHLLSTKRSTTRSTKSVSRRSRRKPSSSAHHPAPRKRKKNVRRTN
jgi:hypothetical protein